MTDGEKFDAQLPPELKSPRYGKVDSDIDAAVRPILEGSRFDWVRSPLSYDDIEAAPKTTEEAAPSKIDGMIDADTERILKVISARDNTVIALQRSVLQARAELGEAVFGLNAKIESIAEKIIPTFEQHRAAQRELESERDFYKRLCGVILRGLAGPTIDGVPIDDQGLLLRVTDKFMRPIGIHVERERDAMRRAWLLVVTGPAPRDDRGFRDKLYGLVTRTAQEGVAFADDPVTL